MYCTCTGGHSSWIARQKDCSASLKRLGLRRCHKVSNKGFTDLITKSPLLEDLSLQFCRGICGCDIYEITGKACPQLKHFSLRHERFRFNFSYSVRDNEARGIEAMHELRSLSLVGSDVNNRVLKGIIDACPHLETLFLRDCFIFHVYDDSALQDKCARIKTFTLLQ